MITTEMIRVSNYEGSELIHQSDRTLVYRGQNIDNGQPVVIKLMRNEYPSFSELVQFRNQYAITKSLDLEGIVKSIALERYENRYALIMEDTGGISLAEYQQQSPFSLQQFLEIAIQIAEILHQLHNHCIIHKDIKPANILIRPETQEIKLIDFSISTLLPKETQTIQTPNVLEGTLAYLSPEQTGRMNRGIDYRSDFYSLGVTFYELLTGTLPFYSDDPLELIHRHMAEMPIPLLSYQSSMVGEPMPPMLSDIVMKLMAKNAEDRYQSALGLKYDLEKCLTQYQETGKIEPFELGERDICSRFNIPEKLYGREAEVNQLLAAFERVASPPTPLKKGGESPRAEMMLVAGFSGIGKTVVVNEVHKPIVKQRGYFIKGKFDQFNRNIPFSAFVQALRDLMGQLLSESDEQLAQWKAKILTAVGENGRVLVEVIPELQQIIGEQPPVPELSGTAAQNRFNLLFQKFIGVLTAPEHPLVMFLDDLQWVDSASLQLMKLLMEEKSYLLFLGAYRDNEVSPAHPFIMTVEDLKKAQAIVNTITLAPLAFPNTNQLVADTLSCSLELAQPLTELIDRKTRGNPFFTTQFLKALYEDGQIQFNRDRGYWECDLIRVNSLSLTDDVVEFMAQQLQKLPDETQDILKLAACIGNQFDLETLAIVSEQEETETATGLWKALQEGLILPQSEVYKLYLGDSLRESSTQISIADSQLPTYKFLHDRIQQAAYSLIPEDQKQTTHYRIGRLLLRSMTEVERESRIFEIVNQLNQGIALIRQPAEREELARLNLQAARKAQAATAYDAASSYCDRAISLLTADCWQQQYSLALALYNAAAENAYLNGNFPQMEERIAVLWRKTQTVRDRVKACEVKIEAYKAQNQRQEAVEIGLEILEQLGVTFPKRPGFLHIGLGLAKIQIALVGQKIPNLVNLPPMVEPDKLAAMQILVKLNAAAYFANPKLFPLIVFEQVGLSLKYGNAPESAIAYATYAVSLCGIVGNIEAGYQFGQLSLTVLERFNAKHLASLCIYIFNFAIRHWKEPLQNTIEPLLNAYQIGLETGDLELVAFSLQVYGCYSFYMGKELSELQKEMVAHQEAILQFKQESALHLQELCLQVVSNLRGETENPWELDGEFYDEKTRILLHQKAQDTSTICLLYIQRLILCYLFQKPSLALQYAECAEPYLEAVTAKYDVPLFYFYSALTRLALLDSDPKSQQKPHLKSIASARKKLKKWADLAPANHQHKSDLLEAEWYRVRGNRTQALELYDRAIAGAKENGYIQEEALGNELFAKFYLDWGQEKYAAVHMQDAYYCYAQWGAKAKTDDLEQRYPELLKPILDRASTSSISGTSLSTVTSHSQTATVANISSLLDFSSLLKASQTLSGEIELDRLLSTLMKIILENAGATKGALLLTSETGLTVDAIATRHNEDLQFDSVHQSIPLDDYPDLPSGLINTVKRTKETALLDAKSAQEKFAAEPYFQGVFPQSLLCVPLLERGNLIGVLYLENTLTADVFTRDRVELLDALCAQAAISLSNARLYQKAQQALKDLQNAQLQLVQNEKMATLGNLVAGVAHEINNPVGFIGGNINAAQEHLQDLLEIVALYQENASVPESIIEEIEDLDPEFIAEDFPKLIASMQTGCDRIRNISTSLRTFSRTDTDAKTEFNLHEGIDSTLLILKYRLKANDNRPAIEIVKEYGNIPAVKCYAGQINQVFMNLIANGIDALDESNEGKTFAEIEKSPNRITISTQLSEDSQSIVVRIGDNGKGMPEEVRAQIFEQGFTTKGVGKGTGLGLAIARQIIIEKHQGTLTCHSELGKGTEFAIALPVFFKYETLGERDRNLNAKDLNLRFNR